MSPDPAPPDAVRLEVLAARFRGFDVGDPLYHALCATIAARPDWLAMLWQAPRGQQLPNLWLAALHDRVLAGSDHPLREYFASVGGSRAPDAALPTLLAGFVESEQAALLDAIRSRRTQTNEIGRCAVLWPALCWIAHRHGVRELALFDLGCSAGLNLGVDRYRYTYRGAGADSKSETAAETAAEVDDDPARATGLPEPPRLVCRTVGPLALPSTEPAPRIVARLGVDPAPVDVADARALRGLRACIWPHDRARDRRLRQAAALAQRERWPVRAADDCLAAVAPWLDTLPAGALPLVFNSWVLHYFEPAALAAHCAGMTALMRERGVVWLSAEGPHVRIAPLAVPPPHEAASDPVAMTLWTCGAAADGGALRFELLARSHAHGHWLEWLAAQPG